MTDKFLRTVAAEVKGHDAEYEETLKEREKANPKFAFLQRSVSVGLLNLNSHGLLL